MKEFKKGLALLLACVMMVCVFVPCFFCGFVAGYVRLGISFGLDVEDYLYRYIKTL